jgi:hypothetical protein
MVLEVSGEKWATVSGAYGGFTKVEYPSPRSHALSEWTVAPWGWMETLVHSGFKINIEASSHCVTEGQCINKWIFGCGDFCCRGSVRDATHVNVTIAVAV